MIRVLACSMILVVSGSWSFAQSGGGSQAPLPSGGTGSAPGPKSDAVIEKCIVGKLKAPPFRADDLKVTVRSGTAVLTGSTKIAAHKANATRLARGCGASRVGNRIAFAGRPGSPASGGGSSAGHP